MRQPRIEDAEEPTAGELRINAVDPEPLPSKLLESATLEAATLKAATLKSANTQADRNLEVDSSGQPQYRTLSGLALLALLLSLASPLSLINLPLLVVPLAAAVIAVVALRRIAANADILSGQRLALAGLFLSIFFLAYMPVRLWTRYEMLTRFAAQLPVPVLDLLEERQVDEAHRLSGLRYARPDLSNPNPENKLVPADLEGFKEEPIIKRINELDGKFTYHLDAFESSPANAKWDLLVLRYQIVPDPALHRKPFPVWFSVSRTTDPGKTEWKITRVGNTNPANSSRNK